MDRRKQTLSLPGSTQAGLTANVTALDISRNGVLLKTGELLNIGDRLTVTLPDENTAIAQVLWTSADLYGCRFTRPISEAAISAARLRGDAIAPDAAISAEPLGESFGARLRRLRKLRQISLVGLSRTLGVSKPTVWKWERDEVRPRAASLDRLSEVLEVTPQELLFGSTSSQSEVQAPRLADSTYLTAILNEAKSKVAEFLGVRPEDMTLTVSIRE